MSWSTSIPSTPPADFPAAVDSSVVSPPEDGLAPEPKAQLEAARAAAKELASHFDGGKPIGASLSGHACTEGTEGLDSISVLVSEREPVPVA